MEEEKKEKRGEGEKETPKEVEEWNKLPAEQKRKGIGCLVFIAIAILIGIFSSVRGSGGPEYAIRSFSKAVAEVEKSMYNATDYPYISYITLGVNEKKKEIRLFAAVDPAVEYKPSLALDCADSLIRLTHTYVSALGGFEVDGKRSELKPPAKDYYGGLWDYYDCWVMVFPHLPGVSTEVMEKRAFVNRYIQKGMHVKQAPRVEKMYEDAYVAEGIRKTQ